MLRFFPFILLSALPLAAQPSAEDLAFSAGIREFLPPPATAMPQPPPAELSFTPDAPRAENSAPDAHPEAYKQFIDQLNTIFQNNEYNFYPALRVILETTNDEFALMSWMEKAIADGNPAACQFVANRRLTRVSQTKLQAPETKEAFALVKKAADAGFIPAKINLSMCMKTGIGTTKDEDGANKTMFDACRSGNEIARFKWLQMTGRLTDWEDRERPEVAAEIERGNHHILFYLSAKAPTQEDHVGMIRKAAEMGNPDAIYALSALSHKAAPKHSLTLLKEAAGKHCADAFFALGTAMVEGDPNNPDLREAGIGHNDPTGRAYIKLASMLGNVSACFWLGTTSYYGKCGMPQDKERAFRHFDTGANIGNATCGTAAGIMLLRGLGIPQDARKGLFYLNTAANMGVPHAVIMLAYAQFEGIGIPADAKAATKILQEAAAMGQKRAYIYLAYITAKGGNKLPADPKLSERYVRMAALDMGDEARTMFDKLMAEGWAPEP